MNLLIIEDEPAAERHLCRILKQCDNSVSVVDTLDSVDASIKWLTSNTLPDLIFMDIQLSDGISFEIFQNIDLTVPVIFCTAYDEYAIDAFKANSIDYLLKPIDRQAVCDSLSKFKKLQIQWTKKSVNIAKLLEQMPHGATDFCSRLLVKTGKNYISIACDEISYISIEYKIVSLTTLDGKNYALEHTLDELEDMLDDSVFFRVNRQTILSIRGIVRVEHNDGRLTVILDKQPKIPIIVSRDKSSTFKSWLGN